MLMVFLNIQNSNVTAGKERGKADKCKNGLFDSLFTGILNSKGKTKKQSFLGKSVSSFFVNFGERKNVKTGNDVVKSFESLEFTKEKKEEIQIRGVICKDRFKNKNFEKLAVLSDGFAGFVKKGVVVDLKSEVENRKKKNANFFDKSFSRESVFSDLKKEFKVKNITLLKGKGTVIKERNSVFSYFSFKVPGSIRQDKENREVLFFKNGSEVKHSKGLYLILNKDEEINVKGNKIKLLRGREKVDAGLGQSRKGRNLNFSERLSVFKKLDKDISIERKSKEVKDISFKSALKEHAKENMAFIVDIIDTDKEIQSDIKLNIQSVNERIKLQKQKEGKFNLLENLADEQNEIDKSLSSFRKTLKKNVVGGSGVNPALEDKKKEIKAKEFTAKDFQLDRNSEKISEVKFSFENLQVKENAFQSEKLNKYYQKKDISISEKEIESSLKGKEGKVNKVQFTGKEIKSIVKSVEKATLGRKTLDGSKKEEKEVYFREVYKRKILKSGLDKENRNFRLVEHKFESFITDRLTDRRFDMDRRNVFKEFHFTDTSSQMQNYHNVSSSGSSANYLGDNGNGYSNHNNSLAGNSLTNLSSEKFVLSARFEDLRLKAKMVKRFINVTIEIPQITFSFADLKEEIREILRNSNLAGLKVKVKSKGKEIYSETVFSDEIKSTSSLELRV